MNLRLRLLRPSLLPALLAALLAGLPAFSLAASPRPVVLELFTSQGCSSCPPADSLLGELAKRPDVIALAYHVDYWDYLGWRDPYSIPEAAQRQRWYARQLHAYSLFTPQLMVDGHRSVVGSQRARVLDALDEAQTERSGATTHMPSAEVSARIQQGSAGAELVVDVNAASDRGNTKSNAKNYRVVVVGYLPAAETRVARGENGNRTLREYNIVRGLRELGDWHGPAASYRLPLAALPATASAVAVLVQDELAGDIAGATQLTLTLPK